MNKLFVRGICICDMCQRVFLPEKTIVVDRVMGNDHPRGLARQARAVSGVRPTVWYRFSRPESKPASEGIKRRSVVFTGDTVGSTLKILGPQHPCLLKLKQQQKKRMIIELGIRFTRVQKEWIEPIFVLYPIQPLSNQH